MSSHPMETEQTPLQNLLSLRVRVNWEVAVYIVILVIAVLTRFTNLGDRVMSHDESLHTRFSWNLYAEGNFQHTPLMHGPILFHMVGLSYSLFGDSDFSARVYPALLGVLMVLSPLLFRHWLKRWGALLTSVGILISPLLLYYHRYIREDTPAIMAGIVMIWAILSYLSGPPTVRYKPYWFYVLAFGMIWNLGTKETAFMYVAIIGIFLALYWFVRVVQQIMTQRAQVFNGRRVFLALSLGTLLGGVLALGMYVILDIIKFDLVSPTTGFAFSDLSGLQQYSYLVWTFLAILLVLLVLVGTIFWAYRRQAGRLPIAQFAFFLGMMFASAFLLVVFEEVFHTSTPDETALRWSPLLAVWAVCIVVSTFFLVFRRRAGDVPADRLSNIRGSGLWGFLDLFPEFDLMVVIGTLILPWAAALIPYMMHGTTEDFTAVGQNWGALAAIIRLLPNPAANPQNVWQDFEVGQVLLGFASWLPLMITSIVIGLSWNWRRWLITAGVFYSIFAFFFTTMFTNLYGLMTGMYYSLGYWLEQQGVRRGSQPQYYYLLVILPMYEFLAVIGSVLAMFTGLTLYWKRVAHEDTLQDELQAQLAYESDSLKNEQGVMASPVADEPLTDDLPDLPSVDHIQSETLLETSAGTYSLDTFQRLYDLRASQRLEELPFLIFWAWIAVFNLIVFTLAGEKMPWLGTHMALPMLFLTGWFVGGVVSRINPQAFLRRGWLQTLVLVVFMIALLQVVGAWVVGDRPFQGLTIDQLRATNHWLLSLVAMIISLGGLVALSTGWSQTRRLLVVGLFGFLAFLTFRSAWMASFVNYDRATEFLVYAHSAPAVKTVLNMIDEISLRTTDSNELVFAYDNEVSWPYSWYFRNYPKAVFYNATPTMQNLQDAIVIIAGDGNRSKVEPLIEDRYQYYRFIRMWWPMQDYFELNVDRVDNLLDFSPENTTAAQIRQGIFDIWWNRDYSTYGTATGKTFSIPNWPVQNAMNVWVRKDVVAQIWQFGTGDGTVQNPLDTIEVNQCNANFQDIQPLQVLTVPNGMVRPLGMTIGPDGNLYAAEENNNRISVFSPQGDYLTSYGSAGSGFDGLQLNRPNSISFDPQGNPIVVDSWNHRVLRLSPDFQQVTASWGQLGMFGLEAQAQPTDSFWGPRDVKVDAQGRILVADTGNKRVRVYEIVDNNAVWSYDLGTGGSEAGQLDEPSGIAIHPTDGRVFVAEAWNRRISVFASTGEFLTSFKVPGWYQQIGNEPYLAVDAERNLIYATDPDAGRVLVFTTSGDCVGSFASLAGLTPLPNQLALAGGITVDSAGNVYVSDAGLGRIIKFPPFPLVSAASDSGEGILLEPVLETTEEMTMEVQPVNGAETTADAGQEATQEATAAE